MILRVSYHASGARRFGAVVKLAWAATMAILEKERYAFGREGINVGLSCDIVALDCIISI